jgi:hypothetical protein
VSHARPHAIADLDRVRPGRDPGLGSDDVDERTERRVFPVRGTAAREPAHLGIDYRAELRQQPRLPETRLADHGHELGGAPARDALDDLPKRRQLQRAADQLDRSDTPPTFGGTDHAPQAERRRLPLDRDRLELLEREAIPDRLPRSFPDHQPVARRDRLQTARGVDHITCHRFTDPWPGPEGDHRLARRDRDPDRDPRIVPAELLEGAEHVETRQDRSLGIVVVGDRCAEHAHRGVADELVQGAAVALDGGLGPGVEGDEGAPDILGVGRIGAFGEPDEIREEDRDVPSLFGRLHGGQRRPARHAEASLGRVDRPAVRARSGHGMRV